MEIPNSVSTYLRKCVALAVFGMGVLSAAECPTATVAVYVANFGFGKGTCTITGTTPMGGTAQLTISQFKFVDLGISLPDANLLVTPLKDPHGLGFQITPTVPWTTAGNGHRLDDEVQYVATVTSTAVDWPGIDRLYTELNGSVTDGAFDQVVEVYCPGGFTLPPDQLCPATNQDTIPNVGQAQTLYVRPTPPGSGTSVVFRGALYFPGPHGTCIGAFNTTNCVYSSIAVNKDTDANDSLGGIATITRVINQFGPPIKPPSPPPPPLTLACPAATTGIAGAPYSSALIAGGGIAPYTYSISMPILFGSLPDGLTLNTTTGEITGAPTRIGSFTFTASVVDSSGNPAVSTTCGIQIQPARINYTCSPDISEAVLQGHEFGLTVTLSGGVNPRIDPPLMNPYCSDNPGSRDIMFTIVDESPAPLSTPGICSILVQDVPLPQKCDLSNF